MTRDEAITRIREHMVIHKLNEPRAIKISEALNTAIEALEQKPCDDAISRQAVLEYIEGSEAELGHSTENELVCQYIKELPPVITRHRKSETVTEFADRCRECGAKYGRLLKQQESEEEQ